MFSLLGSWDSDGEKTASATDTVFPLSKTCVDLRAGVSVETWWGVGGVVVVGVGLGGGGCVRGWLYLRGKATC